MKQRIQEQTEPKKLGGSVYITLSPVVRRVAGIEIGQAVTVIAEAGKIVIVREAKDVRRTDNAYCEKEDQNATRKTARLYD